MPHIPKSMQAWNAMLALAKMATLGTSSAKARGRIWVTASLKEVSCSSHVPKRVHLSSNRTPPIGSSHLAMVSSTFLTGSLSL